MDATASMGLIVLLTVIALLWLCKTWDDDSMLLSNPSLTRLEALEVSDLEKTRDNLQAVQAYARNWSEKYQATMGSSCYRYLPSFHAENWNATESEIQYNNCYAYAFRDLNLNRHQKPQPGNIAQIAEVPSNQYTCSRVFANTKADHPGVVPWRDDSPCPCGYYKAFLVLDTKGQKTDFHYLRQDNTGLWSQKLGSGAATRLDAANHFITNPRTADLDYGIYNYTERCGSFCIPVEKGDVD